MLNLMLLIDSYTNGYKIEVLDLLSLMALLCGILVIVSKNPIVSVLFLIGLFSTIACYLITLGISFLGLAYLLVYVGAVSILFLFILMLINVRVSELFSNPSNSIPLAIFIAVSYNYPVDEILPYSVTSFYLLKEDLGNLLQLIFSNDYVDFFKYFIFSFLSDNKILLVTSQSWDGYLAESSHITSIGNIMYTNYMIWLILTSIILLLAMIGAIAITINKPKKEGSTYAAKQPAEKTSLN